MIIITYTDGKQTAITSNQKNVQQIATMQEKTAAVASLQITYE